MSWLDDLVGGVGDIFSGVGSAVGNLTSSIGDWFGGGASNLVDNVGKAGGISQTATNLTPFDAQTVGDAWSGGGWFDPSSLNLSNFVSTGTLTDVLNAGFNGSNLVDGVTVTAPKKTPATSVQPATPPNTSGLIPSPNGTLMGPQGSGGVSIPRQPSQPGPPAAPQTTPAAPASGGGLLSGILGGNGSLAALLGMVPGVMNLIGSKDQTDLGPDAAKLRAMADQNRNTEAALQNEAQAEKTGQLPGPAMAQLEASAAASKAAMASRYASMGMSGSSAEGADMTAINQQTEAQRFSIGMSMANEALGQVSGLQSQDVGIYQNLMDQQTQRDNEYMQAMSELWAGLGKAFSGSGAQATAAPGAVQTSASQLLSGVSGPVTSVLPDPQTIPTVDQATLPDTSGLIPSPVGGLTVPGLTDPNAGLITIPGGATFNPNIDWSSALGSGAPTFDLSSYLAAGGAPY